MKRTLSFFAIGTILLFLFFQPGIMAQAQADTLVIGDNGAISLEIGPAPVLGESTDKKPAPKKEEPKRETVAITPPNKPATVTIHPVNESKVNVTVTEPSKNPTPTTGPTNASPGTVVTTRQVDNVVVQGQNNTVIMNIAPSSSNELTIQDQGVQAQTSLPLSIDAMTHKLSAQGSKGNVNVIPPKIVLQTLVNEGLAAPSTLNGAPNPPVPAQLSLSTKGGDVIYTVTQERKLFNTIPLPPSVITVSNSTGKSEVPVYSRLFGLFLR